MSDPAPGGRGRAESASVDPAGPPRLAYGAAALVGIFAFAFRVLALRSLSNDHYLYLSAAQQILIGDRPGRDFVEPGMLLQFLLSAAGQAIAPGPAAEGVLTAAMLALAAAATVVAVAWLTRSVAAGALAALFQVFMLPRLYSFPKILVPAVLVVLVMLYARRPGARRLLVPAAWVAAAFLLRHDIGAYAAIGMAAGVALAHRRVANAVQACATLTGFVLLALLPYGVFLAWNGGVAEHVRGAFEYGEAEWHQLRFSWPTFTLGWRTDVPLLPQWDRPNAAAFFFYAAYALPILACLLLLARSEYRRDVLIRSALGAAIVLAVSYAAIILRHPLVTRVQDLASVYAIVGAWSAVALLRATQWRAGVVGSAGRIVTRAGLAAVAAVAVLSIEVLGEARLELRETGLLNSLGAVSTRAREVITDGTQWPWHGYWPAGTPPPAIEYLDACLDPGDRIWITWQAPEYYVFARRGFGAGHPMTMAPHSFTTVRDQELMIARLERYRVPLVLINESRRAELSSAYPRVDEYLRGHYMVDGAFTIRGDESIAIAIRRGLVATGTYGPQAWPCRLQPAPPAAPGQIQDRQAVQESGRSLRPRP